jgi:hypothetical protein
MRKAGEREEKYAARYFTARDALKASELELEKAKQALILLAGASEGINGDGWRMFHGNRKGFVVRPKAGYVIKPGRRFRMVS